MLNVTIIPVQMFTHLCPCVFVCVLALAWIIMVDPSRGILEYLINTEVLSQENLGLWSDN